MYHIVYFCRDKSLFPDLFCVARIRRGHNVGDSTGHKYINIMCDNRLFYQIRTGRTVKKRRRRCRRSECVRNIIYLINFKMYYMYVRPNRVLSDDSRLLISWSQTNIKSCAPWSSELDRAGCDPSLCELVNVTRGRKVIIPKPHSYGE